jgi:peptidoglycan/xylan/chitin deacetylase (PgdA/CDA1 family)
VLADIPVLLYHRIGKPGQPGDFEWVARDLFEKQMRFLVEHDFVTISVAELVQIMKASQLPKTSSKKQVVISIDDGWRSQLEIIPILEKLQLHAAFLIFPEAGLDDQYLDYLRTDELKRIAANPNFEIVSHSLTHPWNPKDNLVTWTRNQPAGRSLADVRQEIFGSRALLEKIIGKPVVFFGWPAGYYNDESVEMAKAAGYQALLTIDPGANKPGDNVFAIKRLFVDGACPLERFKLLLETSRPQVCSKTGAPRTNHLPN